MGLVHEELNEKEKVCNMRNIGRRRVYVCNKIVSTSGVHIC